MGQVNLPLINKSGVSNYWGSSWSFKDNYNLQFKEDFFLKIVVPRLFINKTSANMFMLKKSSKISALNYYTKSNDLFIFQKSNKEDFLRYLKNKKKTPFYSTKLHIVRYERWIVIFYKVFLPVKKKYLYKNRPPLSGYFIRNFFLSLNKIKFMHKTDNSLFYKNFSF